MILHKLTYTETATGTTSSQYFGSEREAVVFRMGLIKSGKISSSRKDNPIVYIDVPVNKKGLIEWLNSSEQ